MYGHLTRYVAVDAADIAMWHAKLKAGFAQRFVPISESIKQKSRRYAHEGQADEEREEKKSIRIDIAVVSLAGGWAVL